MLSRVVSTSAYQSLWWVAFVLPQKGAEGEVLKTRAPGCAGVMYGPLTVTMSVPAARVNILCGCLLRNVVLC